MNSLNCRGQARSHKGFFHALLTAAHLHTRRTKRDAAARFQAKRLVVRQLYRHGWERQRIIDLFRVIDWLMRLPPELERRLLREIHEIEEERRMPYVTSAERIGREDGLKQGLQQGLQEGLQQGLQEGLQQGLQEGLQQGLQQGERLMLERMLIRRFGPLPGWVKGRLDAASVAELEAFGLRVLEADSLEAVFATAPA